MEEVSDNNNEDNADNNLVNVDEVSAKTPQKKRKESKRNNIYVEVISYLNQKTGKNYSHKSAANQKLINGRVSEGRTFEDFIRVIDIKCEQWIDNPKMSEYLRPATLFAQKNFENYVNEKLKPISQKQSDPRDYEIALNKWIANGGDPDEFDYGK
ncbi:conserved phage C-terminal domain-containing protein [Halalkalibacter krulwichiae]|uniref:Phage conserved hypothetical protein C-terminal domain-containing protein n=2 Tax=Halalkalibacter krulwichiae TaxID=199441 RepID=A0A1X9MIP6_9BACI|nr:conserved phage C-terminal domain-containing protein [Halalkalibacter krulwichiae]ARK32163.1 hypothetical protein BkAM31D_21220 [Halalkalibacter krulwichiae]